MTSIFEALNMFTPFAIERFEMGKKLTTEPVDIEDSSTRKIREKVAWFIASR